MPFKLLGVTSEYLSFIRDCDKQAFVGEEIKNRPFVMVNVKNNATTIPFLIPLTSPSMHRYKATRTQTYVLNIVDPNNPQNDIGLLKINKMIPYLASEVSDFIPNQTDAGRKVLLEKTHLSINAMEAEINQKAQEVFNLVVKATKEGTKERSAVTKHSPSYLKLVSMLKLYRSSAAGVKKTEKKAEEAGKSGEAEKLKETEKPKPSMVTKHRS